MSIVGLGMATQTGVADRMFRALADAGINIEAITTSEIKVSVLVKREQALAALRAVHDEFELDRPPRDRVAFGDKRPAAQARPTPSTSSPGCSGWKTSRSKASRSTSRRRR